MSSSLAAGLRSLAGAAGFDRRWLALSVVTIGSFMTMVDASSISVALPEVIDGFDSSVGEGQLVLTGYLLALAAVMPLSGFLGERVGMKRLYMATVLAFLSTSLLCAFAWSMPSLIFFRVLQGLGGGMLQPLGLAITFTLITPMERARFMVLLGLPMLLAPILGPTVGGFLVEFVDWRAIFLIHLPIGAVTLVLANQLLRETPVRHALKLDVKGFALSLVALPFILLGLSRASESGWGSGPVLFLLMAGLTALALFVAVELSQKEPLLQLRLLGNRMFSIGMSLSFVSQVCFFGTQFLLPLFLRNVQELGAARIGLILFPSAILDFVAINISGRLYTRLGPKPLAVAGFAVMGGTAFALSQVNAGTGSLVIALIASLRGLGMGLGMMPVMTMAYNTVPQADMSRATALQNVMMRVFGSAATALITTVLVLSLDWNGAPAGATLTSPDLPARFLVMSFRDAFLFMGVIGFIGTALCFLLRDPLLEQERTRPA